MTDVADIATSPTAKPAPTLAWTLLIVAIAVWMVVFWAVFFVTPQKVELFAMVGADLPLPTVMVINLYDVMQAFWYLLPFPAACLIGVGAMLAMTAGHRGVVLGGLISVVAMGCGALLFVMMAFNLAEMTLVRALPPAPSAREAIMARPEPDYRLEQSEPAELGGRVATRLLRIQFASDARVEDANAVLSALGAVVVAGEPSTGWIVVMVDSAGAAEKLAQGKPGVIAVERCPVPE